MIINQVYEARSPSFDMTGRHRVLWLDDENDEVLTIEIPNVSGKRTPKYVKSPKLRVLSDLSVAVDSGDLIPVHQRMTGIFAMSDKNIERRYPRKTKGKCKALAIRDKHYAEIRLLAEKVRDDRDGFFSDGNWRDELRAEAKKTQLGTNLFYTAFNKYLAFGVGRNALLPFYFRSGGRGKTRNQKRRLGNKSAAIRCGLVDENSEGLSDDDKDKLAWGYRVFKTDLMSVKEAYRMTCAVYWSSGTKIENGEELPLLLPSSARPTLAQFDRWGPKGEGNKDAWLTLLSDGEFDSNYRALLGSSMDGVHGIGQFGLADGTSADVHLVSLISRLLPIGCAKRLFIHEAWSSVIAGFDVGLNAPSQQTAMLAVLSAATSKVELCHRYGLDIEENDIPAIFFAKYLVDNGEFRTKEMIATLGRLGSGMELARVGRGDLKSVSESGHKSIHKLTAHKMFGTTKGRQRKRGEAAPALNACWTFHEFMRLILKAIIYYNCEQRVEAFMNAHPYGTAMKADGVPPIRKAIYEWGLKKGLLHCPAFDEDALRAALLPTMRALVKGNGVFLIRPDVGRRKDLVQSHRFVGPRIMALEWMEKARRSGTFEIEVKVDPNDLAKIWMADDHGFHELANVCNDVLLVQQGSLHDTLAIQDNGVIERSLDQQRDDQAHSDFVVSREVSNEHYLRLKKSEIAAAPGRVSKKQLTSDIEFNRELEKDLISTDKNRKRSPVQRQVPSQEDNDAGVDDNGDWMAEILEAHRER